jgi:hypothetical protein
MIVRLTPKFSCERFTTKWQRAKRAAIVRQIARQLQRSLGCPLETPIYGPRRGVSQQKPARSSRAASKEPPTNLRLTYRGKSYRVEHRTLSCVDDDGADSNKARTFSSVLQEFEDRGRCEYDRSVTKRIRVILIPR